MDSSKSNNVENSRSKTYSKSIRAEDQEESGKSEQEEWAVARKAGKA